MKGPICLLATHAIALAQTRLVGVSTIAQISYGPSGSHIKTIKIALIGIFMGGRERAEGPTKDSCSGHSTNSPGGCEHERKDSIRLARKALQDRQRECGCLATAGVSRSEHVAPLKDGGDASALHLCGPHHAQRFAHPAQPAGQGS